MAVTLPAVLLILDWYPLGRINSKKTFVNVFAEKIPFIACSAAISLVSLVAQNELGALKPLASAPFFTRLLVAIKSLVVYLWKMIVPHSLVPFYPYPRDVSLFSTEYVLAIALVFGVTALSIVYAKKQRVWLAAWGYYFVTLLPVLGLIKIGDFAMADRFTYLPSLGPFLVIGLIVAKVYERVLASNRWKTLLRTASYIIATALIVSLSFYTIKQIEVWRNSITLWGYVIDKFPGTAPVAHNNLGIAFEDQGNSDQAIDQYQVALKIYPEYADAHFNLGRIYAKKGYLDQAIQEFQAALQINPGAGDTHNSLGIAYAMQGHIDQAINEFKAAMQIDPNLVEAHINLGQAYAIQGHNDQAMNEFQTALKLDPENARARRNLESLSERIKSKN